LDCAVTIQRAFILCCPLSFDCAVPYILCLHFMLSAEFRLRSTIYTLPYFMLSAEFRLRSTIYTVPLFYVVRLVSTAQYHIYSAFILCCPLSFNCVVPYCHVLGGSVTNNSTWIRIGYRIYSLRRFTAATQVTITVNTKALVASQIPLTKLYCTDVSLRRLNWTVATHWLTHSGSGDSLTSDSLVEDSLISLLPSLYNTRPAQMENTLPTVGCHGTWRRLRSLLFISIAAYNSAPVSSLTVAWNTFKWPLLRVLLLCHSLLTLPSNGCLSQNVEEYIKFIVTKIMVLENGVHYSALLVLWERLKYLFCWY
jgi:hypothetical protein